MFVPSLSLIIHSTHIPSQDEQFGWTLRTLLSSSSARCFQSAFNTSLDLPGLPGSLTPLRHKVNHQPLAQCVVVPGTSHCMSHKSYTPCRSLFLCLVPSYKSARGLYPTPAVVSGELTYR